MRSFFTGRRSKTYSAMARGFSLIEIMIVMAIAGGIIAAIAVYVTQKQTQVDESKAKTAVITVATEIGYFKLNNGRFPESLEELVSPPNGGVPQLKEKQIQDPWGHKLIYVYPGMKNPNSFDLCSTGKEGKDCVYWYEE